MEGAMNWFAVNRIQVLALNLALIAFIVPYKATAQAPISSADAFGQCAKQNDLDTKIAACMEASKATPYPWILHWVYRELARAQRGHGESEKAIISYERSLAAREDTEVRREMENLVALRVLEGSQARK
jgi:hypothetical protein